MEGRERSLFRVRSRKWSVRTMAEMWWIRAKYASEEVVVVGVEPPPCAVVERWRRWWRSGGGERKDRAAERIAGGVIGS